MVSARVARFFTKCEKCTKRPKKFQKILPMDIPTIPN
jgi:hypothetical protein